MSNEVVDIQGCTEPEAIERLIEAGYGDRVYRTCDWEQGYSVVDVIEGDESRWTRHMQSIIQAPSGKYFSVDWERGLTEYQEQGPFEGSDPSPVEVKRVEKVVTTVEWVTV